MPRVCFVLGLLALLSSCGETQTVPEDDLGDTEPDAPVTGQNKRLDASGDLGGGGVGASAPDARARDAAGDASEPERDGALEAQAADQGPDAGAADHAGATNAPGVGGSPACTKDPAILCEDFEETAVGSVPAGWTRQGSASTVDESPARGARTLRARSPQNVTYSVNRVTRRLTIPGTHWGRIYYNVAVPAPRPPSGVIHATFVLLTGNLPGGGAAEFRVVDTVVANNGQHQFLYNVQPQNGREFGRSTKYDWRYDGKWHCAEWFIDEANQAFSLYLDGGAMPVLSFRNGPGNYSGSQIPRSFSGVSVGVAHYQNSRSGFVVSLDELKIDSKRVGCN